MLDVLKVILENTPTALLVLLGVYATWFAARIYFVMIRKTKDKVDGYEQRFDNIDQKLSFIENSLQILISYLKGKGILSQDFLSKKSPLVLNKLGVEILEKSGGKDIIDSNYDTICKALESEGKSISAWELYNKTLFTFINLLNNKMFLNIHKFLYNNPSYKGKALPELDIITILSVYFRDKYLEQYPELVQ